MEAVLTVDNPREVSRVIEYQEIIEGLGASVVALECYNLGGCTFPTGVCDRAKKCLGVGSESKIVADLVLYKTLT